MTHGSTASNRGSSQSKIRNFFDRKGISHFGFFFACEMGYGWTTFKELRLLTFLKSKAAISYPGHESLGRNATDTHQITRIFS